MTGTNIVAVLERIALIAETSNHHTPDGTMRLMPAAGVCDDLYTAMEHITTTEAKLTKAVEALREILMKPRSVDQTYVELWADTIKEIRSVLAELEGK